MASVSKNVPASPTQALRRRRRVDRLLDPVLFKALSDPTRVVLLSCLLKCGRRCSVTEISGCCSLDFSMVARHMTALASAGLVESVKEGRTVWYSVDGDALAGKFADLAAAITEADGARCCDASDDCGCC